MPFEDRLGEALRHTGDGFAPDDQGRLVDAGLARGRRRLARRRTAAVATGVLTLAVAGLGGAYADGLLAGSNDGTRHTAAAVGDAPVSGKQMTGLLTSLLPRGDTSKAQGRGAGGAGDSLSPSASVVFDDGQGAGLVSVQVSRVDPTSQASKALVTCPPKAYVHYDACTRTTLSDGSWFMVLQGYEYPDRREPTKDWRAVRLTGKGVLVDVQEWNAPAEKGSRVTRQNPPLSAARLKAVATSGKWLPVGERLDPVTAGPAPETPVSGAAIRKQFVALLPKDRHLRITDKGGSLSEFAYLVLDDGKGKSLVQINVQQHMGDVVPRGRTSTLPDGTRIGLEKAPGEKGGAGVVMWTADVVHPDGFRVVIAAFNTGTQHDPATRRDPALSLKELKKIALAPSWGDLHRPSAAVR